MKAVCSTATNSTLQLHRAANSPDFRGIFQLFRPILRLYDSIKKTPAFHERSNFFCRFPKFRFVLFIYSYCRIERSKRHKSQVSAQHSAQCRLHSITPAATAQFVMTNLCQLGTVSHVQNDVSAINQRKRINHKIRTKVQSRI